MLRSATAFMARHAIVPRLSIAQLMLIVVLVTTSDCPAQSLGSESQQTTMEQTMQSGPVELRIALSPEKPVIGDTLTLVIEVTAKQGVEVLMPEFGDVLDRFTIRDFAPRRSIDSDGNLTATQTYRLDPPSSGQQVIPPILIEYIDRRDGQQEAPEGLDAYEILTDRMPFEVRSVLPQDAAADLKPPMAPLEIHSPEPKRNWWWMVVPLVICVIAAPFLYRALVAARRRRRRKSAYEVAQSRLTRLLDAPRETADQINQFYVELSFVIRKYIEDRFEMRAPELTTEEFLASIGSSPDFSPDHQSLLREFLRRADLVKFARAEPSESEMKNAIDSVARFLEETRENAPLLEEDDSDG